MGCEAFSYTFGVVEYMNFYLYITSRGGIVLLSYVNRCCTFFFQVDLEPQGRLRIRIELKWKSQGT